MMLSPINEAGKASEQVPSGGNSTLKPNSSLNANATAKLESTIKSSTMHVADQEIVSLDNELTMMRKMSQGGRSE